MCLIPGLDVARYADGGIRFLEADMDEAGLAAAFRQALIAAGQH